MSKVTPFLVTSNDTIRRDLLASLNRVGVRMGTTWGSFKRAVEAFGVTDRTPLEAIEVGVHQQTGRIGISEESVENGGITVYEMSDAQLERNGVTR